MKIECRTELSLQEMAEWRAFLSAARHQHMRQDPKYADAERAKGNSPLFVIGRHESGAICAVAWLLRQPHRLLSGRFVVARVLSGPVCDDPGLMLDFLDALAAHPALADTDGLTITPYWLGEEAADLARRLAERGWTPSDPEHFRRTGLIDLTRSEHEIRSSFSRSARRKLRLIEKSGVVIRPMETLAEAEIFFERLSRLVLSRIGFAPIHPAEYPSAIENTPGESAGAAIFGAWMGETFLGGVLVYRGLRSAHAARYVADPEAARAVADNLRVAPSLWLAGMLWAKQQGCVVFDVEGFQLVEDMNHPYFNVYEYKREMNPAPVQRLREHSRPIHNVLYRIDGLPRRMARTYLSGLIDQIRKPRR